MVLLAAAVCTKGGKPLVSRQFVELSRPRVEGLFVSFPKLVSESKGEHTFIDTDTVRYVYQPLDEMFLVLLTSLNSNIMEDLETLHMFARIVPEFCNSISEVEIAASAFDLISAFDEVVSMGYKENVTLHQIKMFTDMDSHAERMDDMMRKNREQEAKLEAKRWAERHQKEEEEKRRMGIGMGSKGSRLGSGGMGRSTPGGYGGGSASNSPRGGYGGGAGGASPNPSSAAPTKKVPSGNAMKLGSKSKGLGSSNVDALIAESGMREVTGTRAKVTAPQNVDAGLENVTEPLVLSSTETVDVKLTRDGGLESMKLMGSLSVILREEEVPFMIGTRMPESVAKKIDPNCDKEMFAQRGILAFKDKTRKFPVNNQGTTLLRWRMQTQDESKVPLLITCWPAPSPTGFGMNIEVEHQGEFPLNQCQILIPCPRQPDIASFTGDDAAYDKREKVIVWDVGVMGPDATSSNLEFSCGGAQKDDFVPISASFAADGSLCGVKVLGARSQGSNENIRHSKINKITTGTYEVTQ